MDLDTNYQGQSRINGGSEVIEQTFISLDEGHESDENDNLAVKLISNKPISEQLKTFNSIVDLNWAWIY